MQCHIWVLADMDLGNKLVQGPHFGSHTSPPMSFILPTCESNDFYLSLPGTWDAWCFVISVLSSPLKAHAEEQLTISPLPFHFLARSPWTWPRCVSFPHLSESTLSLFEAVSVYVILYYYYHYYQRGKNLQSRFWTST